MKVICAWCKKTIKEDPEDSEGLISHSICSECAKALKAGFDLEKIRKNSEEKFDD